VSYYRDESHIIFPSESNLYRMYFSRGSIHCPIMGMSHMSFFQVNLISTECILVEDH